MGGPADLLDRRLRALYDAGLRRALRPAAGFDLCSNDYLGFARDPVLAERFAAALGGLPCGAGAARLLRGDLEIHARAETALAALSGRHAAVLFPSGYQANLALLSSLLRPGDVVYSDALNHASIIDGVRLGRAERVVYPHADAGALRRLLAGRAGGGPRAAGTGLRVIVTESLFGMDGDVAPLAALAGLADEFGALLVVDEAHATGLYGGPGAAAGGLVSALGLERSVFATVHTGGKALGAAGAWVAGDARLRDYLVNCARPFLFSTGPLPALAALLEQAAAHWRDTGAARAAAVRRRARRWRARLREAGVEPAGAADSPIVPVVLGGNARALRVAAALQARGFDARAVRPPTVPEGTARLRLTVTWPVGGAELARCAAALGAALREAPAARATRRGAAARRVSRA
jgi:8-amino-7-oxononanoate synthase